MGPPGVGQKPLEGWPGLGPGQGPHSSSCLSPK